MCADGGGEDIRYLHKESLRPQKNGVRMGETTGGLVRGRTELEAREGSWTQKS